MVEGRDGVGSQLEANEFEGSVGIGDGDFGVYGVEDGVFGDVKIFRF